MNQASFYLLILKVLVTQLCPTVCDPMDYNPPVSSVHGIFFRQEYWNGLPFLSPGDLTDPGIKPTSPVSPALAEGFFTTEPPGKPARVVTFKLFFGP